jgi:hypothetical protein
MHTTIKSFSLKWGIYKGTVPPCSVFSKVLFVGMRRVNAAQAESGGFR